MTVEERRRARPRGPVGSFGVVKLVLGMLLLGGVLYVCVEAAGGRRMLDISMLNGSSLDVGAALASIGLTMSSSSKGLEIKEYCRSEHSKALASSFLKKREDVPFYTACPKSTWMNEFQKGTQDKALTMVDVGCNKGYTSAHIFGLWAPEVNFSPSTLRVQRPDVGCGTCNDCQEQTTSSLERHVQPVSVYCVEPSTRNFANLILTRDKFFSKDTPADVQWYIINTAMSNSTGMSHFPRGCKDELCSLQGNSDGTTERDYDFVPLSTLDDFFRTYELDSVDLMKVDTEGFDATVISGGMEVLSRHRVGVLAFEYHEVGVWREYSLRDIVDTLDGMNYVCYFDGHEEVSRLTSCWDPMFEMYGWSNVVCVHRTHFMYGVLERMSTRYQLHRAEYYGGAGTAGAATTGESVGTGTGASTPQV